MKDEDVRIGMKVVPSNTMEYPVMYVTGSSPDNFDRIKNHTVWILDTKPVSGEFDGSPYYAEEFEPYIDPSEEKVIVVQWNVNDSYRNGGFLSVIKSDYPSMFTVGGTYSLEIMTIALNEGYTVIIKPMDETEKTKP